MNIKITPYHFLCILNNYGEGIELFQPDPKTKNDYYFLANAIIYDDVEHISFTIYNDDICDPCNFFRDEMCIDTINENNINLNKNIYYVDTNKMLFKEMNIRDNCFYNFKYIINLVNETINFEIVNKCWFFLPKEKTKIIYNNIKNGLKKLL